MRLRPRCKLGAQELLRVVLGVRRLQCGLADHRARQLGAERLPDEQVLHADRDARGQLVEHGIGDAVGAFDRSELGTERRDEAGRQLARPEDSQCRVALCFRLGERCVEQTERARFVGANDGGLAGFGQLAGGGARGEALGGLQLLEGLEVGRRSRLFRKSVGLVIARQRECVGSGDSVGLRRSRGRSVAWCGRDGPAAAARPEHHARSQTHRAERLPHGYPRIARAC